MQLYLDCDGVLADFDTGVRRLLGLAPKDYQARHGLGRFWAALGRTPGFYAELPLMPDARELFERILHRGCGDVSDAVVNCLCRGQGQQLAPRLLRRQEETLHCSSYFVFLECSGNPAKRERQRFLLFLFRHCRQ